MPPEIRNAHLDGISHATDAPPVSAPDVVIARVNISDCDRTARAGELTIIIDKTPSEPIDLEPLRAMIGDLPYRSPRIRASEREAAGRLREAVRTVNTINAAARALIPEERAHEPAVALGELDALIAAALERAVADAVEARTREIIDATAGLHLANASRWIAERFGIAAELERCAECGNLPGDICPAPAGGACGRSIDTLLPGVGL